METQIAVETLEEQFFGEPVKVGVKFVEKPSIYLSIDTIHPGKNVVTFDDVEAHIKSLQSKLYKKLGEALLEQTKSGILNEIVFGVSEEE